MQRGILPNPLPSVLGHEGAGAPYGESPADGVMVEVRQRGDLVPRDPGGRALNRAGDWYGPVWVYRTVAVQVRNTGAEPIRIAIAVDWS